MDANGKLREKSGCPDKQSTTELARHAETEVAKIKAGQMDPKDLMRQDHLSRPTGDHIAEFKSYILACGRTEKHADLFIGRASVVTALVRNAKLSEIEAGNRATRQDTAKAREKLSGYLKAARLTDFTVEKVQSTLASL